MSQLHAQDQLAASALARVDRWRLMTAQEQISWRAPHATIVAIEETDVRMTERASVLAIGQQSRWGDGTPVCFEDGRLRLTAAMRTQGATQNQLDVIVWPWTRPDNALARVRREHLRTSYTALDARASGAHARGALSHQDTPPGAGAPGGGSLHA